MSLTDAVSSGHTVASSVRRNVSPGYRRTGIPMSPRMTSSGSPTSGNGSGLDEPC